MLGRYLRIDSRPNRKKEQDNYMYVSVFLLLTTTMWM